jgi:hypothetical protein
MRQCQRALDRTVGDVFQGEGLVSVSEDCPVVDALLKLKTVPAVAVVNEWGMYAESCIACTRPLTGSNCRSSGVEPLRLRCARRYQP